MRFVTVPEKIIKENGMVILEGTTDQMAEL
jgi:hypothetical protein